MNQSQKLSMTPQLYQSIKLMELPIMDLREKIEEELEKNPALEVLEDPSLVSLENAEKPPKEVSDDDFFETASDPGFLNRGVSADDHQNFIEGALTRAETLQEHLLWQLALEPVSEEMRRICELLIQNLDDDGFNREPVDILLKGEHPEKIKKAVKLVQELDPPGTCTADYRESLLVQVGLLSGAPHGIVQALSHLELLERGKIAEAAKLTGIAEKEMEHMFEIIKTLSPFPGRSFASGETRYVIPDIQVTKKDGEFIIILNEEEIPVLGVNPFFMEVAESKTPDKDSKSVRDFALENIKEAKWFINSINQRNHSLLKVCRALIEFQRPFFASGSKYLSPLTLQDIAHEIGLHQTTVSRIAHGKYIQTEWGIFEIRHFFTNSITGTGSGRSKYSKEGVKEVVREIIESEATRLSDQDIVGLLAKRGIALARRTVAKYRNELDLRPSFDR